MTTSCRQKISYMLTYCKFFEVFKFSASFQKKKKIIWFYQSVKTKSGKQIYYECYDIKGFITVSRYYMILGRWLCEVPQHYKTKIKVPLTSLTKTLA